MWPSDHFVPVLFLLLAGTLTSSGLPQRDVEELQACGEAFYHAEEVRDPIRFDFFGFSMG